MIERQIDASFEDIGTDTARVGTRSPSVCMKAYAATAIRHPPPVGKSYGLAHHFYHTEGGLM